MEITTSRSLEPGLVETPPMSRISAPLLTISRALARATSNDVFLPPSEKESGVVLRIPMILVRSVDLLEGSKVKDMVVVAVVVVEL
ncbi:hypothetical protein WICPIJ_009988 [Wickerhamomyces pijperi]|uniref:Uncharacterized protein n=1 Tax=Wickerhamomyces pijperi TaxID=599730 RepID=A0A9P8PJ28_WICPI|nr:hypothetical protein WICPIJ_009988 [Wickerhamomyces pijperi]